MQLTTFANGIAERWIGSCRREVLIILLLGTSVISLRLLGDYASYHHRDRLHDSLGKDTSETRRIAHKPTANATVIALPRLGGQHHRYAWHEAA